MGSSLTAQSQLHSQLVRSNDVADVIFKQAFTLVSQYYNMHASTPKVMGSSHVFCVSFSLNPRSHQLEGPVSVYQIHHLARKSILQYFQQSLCLAVSLSCNSYAPSINHQEQVYVLSTPTFSVTFIQFIHNQRWILLDTTCRASWTSSRPVNLGKVNPGHELVSVAIENQNQTLFSEAATVVSGHQAGNRSYERTSKPGTETCMGTMALGTTIFLPLLHLQATTEALATSTMVHLPSQEVVEPLVTSEIESLMRSVGRLIRVKARRMGCPKWHSICHKTSDLEGLVPLVVIATEAVVMVEALPAAFVAEIVTVMVAMVYDGVEMDWGRHRDRVMGPLATMIVLAEVAESVTLMTIRFTNHLWEDVDAVEEGEDRETGVVIGKEQEAVNKSRIYQKNGQFEQTVTNV